MLCHPRPHLQVKGLAHQLSTANADRRRLQGALTPRVSEIEILRLQLAESKSRYEAAETQV